MENTDGKAKPMCWLPRCCDGEYTAVACLGVGCLEIWQETSSADWRVIRR